MSCYCAAALFILACTGGLIRVFRVEIDRLYGNGFARSVIRLLVFFGLLLVVAHTAMTVSSFILGKAIQINHFPMKSRLMSAYCLSVCFAMAVDFIYRSVCARLDWKASWMRAGSAVALTMVCAVVLYQRARSDESSRYDGHLRLDTHRELSNLGAKPYRAEFTDLARYLLTESHGDDLVLGTCDPMVYMWWLTFTRGHSFAADPFVSSVPDRVVEDRLMALCHTIGMTPDQFIAYVKNWTVHSWWLSSNKYQASKAHTFSTLDDYSPEEREGIKGTGLYHTWNTVIPRSELSRLKQQYESMTPPYYERRQLDLIVLTNDKALAPFSPPSRCLARRFQKPPIPCVCQECCFGCVQ